MKLFETEKNKEIKKLRMAQDREWKNIVEDAEETTKELCEKYYEGKWNFTFDPRKNFEFRKKIDFKNFKLKFR